MAIRIINTGTGPNAGNGDSLRSAFTKINQNFAELSTLLGTTGTNINELAQDAARDLLVHNAHSGLTAAYDDPNNRVIFTVAESQSFDQDLNKDSAVTFSYLTVTEVLYVGGDIVGKNDQDIVLNPSGTGIVQLLSPMILLSGDTVVSGAFYQTVQDLTQLTTASVTLTEVQIVGNVITANPQTADRTLTIPAADSTVAGLTLTFRNRSFTNKINLQDSDTNLIASINQQDNITLISDGQSWFKIGAAESNIDGGSAASVYSQQDLVLDGGGA
jgi:hypothetical protein